MEKQSVPSAREEGAAKRRSRMLPLLLLLLLALITSSILGYILGKNAGSPPLGQIIDTIILGPEAPDTPSALHLSGRVVYTNGQPAAGRALELHSDPMTTTSDSGGGFLFANVSPGEHTIYILHEDGTVAAERKIQITREASAENVSIQQQPDGAYLLAIAVDIRVLEIELTLDDQTLTILPDFSYATNQGTVTTPAGSASIRDGVIVTPQGNVFLPSGSVVFPGGGKKDPTRILLPDDSILADQPFAEDGIEVSSDGAVDLPDGTVIEPGGHIKTPGGKEETPGKTGVIVLGEAVTPIGKKPPVKPEDPSSKPENAGISSVPAPPSLPGSTDSSSQGEADSSSGSQPPASSETPSEPEVPDSGELNAYGRNGDGAYTQWTQNCPIDLFYDRLTGDRDLIAPGSSGYYLFRLENSRMSDLHIQVTFTEGSVHLPLFFTLTPLDGAGNKISEKAVSGSLSGRGLTLNTAIASGDTVTYRLDWTWPFEGNDQRDTSAGGGADLIYTLQMKIFAEEGV